MYIHPNILNGTDCLWSVFSISLWLHIVLLAVTLSVLAFLTSSHYTGMFCRKVINKQYKGPHDKIRLSRKS